jgi:5-methylcytosine-specific restriction endonuclease McrA
MDIITRAEAKAQGLTRYFTGKPCKHGHVDGRYASTGACCMCAQKQARDWESSAPADYQRLRKDRVNRRSHARKKARRAVDAEYRARLSQRDSAYVQRRREEDPKVRAAHLARVRVRKRNMSINDLRADELKALQAIYELAIRLTRATGIEYHVDHHIPLAKGGKHHPDNLWVIPAAENLRKGAKLPQELAA